MKEKILFGLIILSAVLLTFYIKKTEHEIKIENNTEAVYLDWKEDPKNEYSYKEDKEEKNNIVDLNQMTEEEMITAWNSLVNTGKDIEFTAEGTWSESKVFGYTGNQENKVLLYGVENDLTHSFHFGAPEESQFLFTKSANPYLHSENTEGCGLYLYNEGKVTNLISKNTNSLCESKGGEMDPISSYNKSRNIIFIRDFIDEGLGWQGSYYYDLNRKNAKTYEEARVDIFEEEEQIKIFFNEGDYLLFSKIIKCPTEGYGREISKNIWLYDYKDKTAEKIEDISDWVVWPTKSGDYNILEVKNFNPDNLEVDFSYEVDEFVDCRYDLQGGLRNI